ncbi:MAG TPA: hypothetical protein VGF54_13025 [Streptosporangiaceae bacterium]
MKVPANLPADRLILEYLSRVAAAGNRHLPKGKRMAFVSTTRNRIWREIGPSGTADADRVREVLAGLGEPEDLVKAERARLDAQTADRLERQAQKKADEAAAAAPGTAPLPYRPGSPGPASPPRRRPPGARGDGGPSERRPSRRGAAGDGKPRRRLGGLLADWQDRLGSHPAPGNATDQGPGRTAGQGPGDTAGQGPGDTAGQAPEHAAGQGPGSPAGPGPGRQGPSRTSHWTPGVMGTQPTGGTASPAPNGAGPQANGGGPGTGGRGPAPGQPGHGVTPAAAGAQQAVGAIPSGAGPAAGEETSVLARGTHALRGAAVTLGNGAVDLALDAAELARQHKLETAAVLLLGISALIFVFPYWLLVSLLGGVVAIWSLTWNARDKWVALAGPPVMALIGTIVAALIIGGQSHFFGSYTEAFRLYVGYAYRGGSLLCAIYLALQARRGPQRRLPPWRR